MKRRRKQKSQPGKLLKPETSGAAGNNPTESPALSPPSFTDAPKPPKTELHSVKSHSRDGRNFIFSDGSAAVEVKVVSDEIIRIRLAPESELQPEFSYAVSSGDFNISALYYTDAEDHFLIATQSVRCRIAKSDFTISFLDSAGKLMNEDQSAMHWEANTDHGGYRVSCSKVLQQGEHFFGLGDKPMNLDLRGKRLENWATDFYNFKRGTDPIYKSIPFYLGLHRGRCYGIFFDNTFRTFFDFGKDQSDCVKFGSDGGEMRYYYIHGPQMTEVVRRYSQLTGVHPLPPKWALGFHQSRWSYFPERKVKKLAQTFRSKKIPCDVVHLDIDYMDGYRCFTWDKRRFPDPAKMISQMAKQGFRCVAIVDPGIKKDEKYWVYREGKINGAFCRRADDGFMEGRVWPGRCLFPDFTDPRVRKWWGGLFTEYVEQGIAGIWNDMNEPAVFGSGTFPHDVRHDFDGFPCSHRKAHNVYGMQMARATYEGLKKLLAGKRPFTISRAGYSGVQRYACTWTGDNAATWDDLKLAVLMLQRLSTSGVSFCGSDIGGFTGEPDAELYIRWIQFGIFSPFMRVHSAGDTRAREPWAFGQKAEAIVKKLIELRYRLMPYLYSVFWEHSRYQYPILRPLLMLEQQREKNVTRDDVFAFGSSLLVAPVTDRGIRNRDVYLPRGTWYRYATSTGLQGGRSHRVSAALHSIPMFTKGGSVIPEGPVMQHVNEVEVKELGLQVYFSRNRVSSMIYDDAGDGYGYERGEYSERKFVTRGEARRFVIMQDTHGSFEPTFTKYRMNVFGLPFKVKKVMIDGNKMNRWNAGLNGVFRLKVPRDFQTIEICS